MNQLPTPAPLPPYAFRGQSQQVFLNKRAILAGPLSSRSIHVLSSSSAAFSFLGR